MLRVAHVAQPTDGGVAGYVARVALDQRDRGWEVAVVCPDGDLADVLTAAGVQRLAWQAGRAPGPHVPAETKTLGRLLERLRSDVVHLHSSKAGLAGRLALRGRVGTVFQPHGWSWYAAPRPLRAATRAWERVATRWADRVVCVSEAEQHAAAGAGVAGPLVVVRNGVDLRRFAPPDEADRARARHRLGVREPLVVCVGRFARQKGQDLLLAAWPPVAAAVPEATLAFVGDGEPPAGAAAVAGVRLVGPTSAVRDWYAAADVVVFPSRWEGLSLALLEAAAMGRCVVATDVGGVREVLGPPAGQAPAAPDSRGAVVPLDPAAIGEAVKVRLRSPELRLAEGAALAAYAARHLDERVMLEELAAVDAAVAAKRLSRPPAGT